MATDKHIDYIEFPAKNPEELKAVTTFYSAAFGWPYKEWGDDYSDTQGSGVSSGVNASEGRPSMPLVVLYAKDLEATMQSVIKAGGKITQDISAFPGGRRFHFYDPAGNELAVWSE
jgi:uncharacterized protein